MFFFLEKRFFFSFFLSSFFHFFFFFFFFRGLALFAPVEARLTSCHFSSSLSVTKRLLFFFLFAYIYLKYINLFCYSIILLF